MFPTVVTCEPPLQHVPKMGASAGLSQESTRLGLNSCLKERDTLHTEREDKYKRGLQVLKERDKLHTERGDKYKRGLQVLNEQTSSSVDEFKLLSKMPWWCSKPFGPSLATSAVGRVVHQRMTGSDSMQTMSHKGLEDTDTDEDHAAVRVDSDDGHVEHSWRKPVNNPRDHLIWAELYWAYSLFANLQPPVKGQEGPPLLGSEACRRMVRGHAQQNPSTEQMAEVLDSLTVGDTPEARELDVAEEDLLAEDKTGCLAKVKGKLKKKKSKKTVESKGVTFLDFVAVLSAWTRGGDQGRTLEHLRHFKRKTFYDIRSDWMVARLLWVSMWLSALIAFPFSWLYEKMQDCRREVLPSIASAASTPQRDASVGPQRRGRGPAPLAQELTGFCGAVNPGPHLSNPQRGPTHAWQVFSSHPPSIVGESGTSVPPLTICSLLPPVASTRSTNTRLGLPNTAVAVGARLCFRKPAFHWANSWPTTGLKAAPCAPAHRIMVETRVEYLAAQDQRSQEFGDVLVSLSVGEQAWAAVGVRFQEFRSVIGVVAPPPRPLCWSSRLRRRSATNMKLNACPVFIPTCCGL